MEEESIYQSAPAAQRTVENSADDRQMDGYVSEKAVYTDVVKQNIDFFDFAEWLKDPDQYISGYGEVPNRNGRLSQVRRSNNHQEYRL